MNINKVLYDYIVEKYGSVVNFSAESGISSIDLSAVLLKENIPREISMGLRLCEILNIDAGEMAAGGQIKELKRGKNVRVFEAAEKSDKIAAKSEIYSKCMRLSEIEKKAVLDYIRNISGKTE